MDVADEDMENDEEDARELRNESSKSELRRVRHDNEDEDDDDGGSSSRSNELCCMLETATVKAEDESPGT